MSARRIPYMKVGAHNFLFLTRIWIKLSKRRSGILYLWKRTGWMRWSRFASRSARSWTLSNATTWKWCSLAGLFGNFEDYGISDFQISELQTENRQRSTQCCTAKCCRKEWVTRPAAFCRCIDYFLKIRAIITKIFNLGPRNEWEWGLSFAGRKSQPYSTKSTHNGWFVLFYQRLDLMTVN